MSDQKGKVRFVRIRGRIVPIRQKISDVSGDISALGAGAYVAAESANKLIQQRHNELLMQKRAGIFSIGKHSRKGILKKLAQSRKFMRGAARTSRIGALVASMAFVSQHVFDTKE